MSQTGEILLGVIAAAVALMALMQLAVAVAGLRLARRVDRLAQTLEDEVKPLIANLTTMSQEASRAAALAAAQVDRVDRLVTDVSARVEKMVAVAQQFLSGPAREGLAVVAGIRAAFGALQAIREAARRRAAVRAGAEDEESLFIG